MTTTRLSKETKNRLINLDFTKKGMSFEDIIKQLIDY